MVIGWRSEGTQAREATGFDGGGKVEVCGSRDDYFPVEVLELVGGDKRLDDELAFGDFGAAVLDESEAFEVFEMEEEVGDCGDVGYV